MKNLQRKNQPLIIVKSRQRAPNYAIQFAVKKLIDGRWSAIAQIQNRGIVKLNSLLMTRARSQRLPRDVLGYPKQPGRELRLFAQRFQAAMRADERFLRQVLRQLAIAYKIVDETDYGSRIPFKDQTKRFLFALARARN